MLGSWFMRRNKPIAGIAVLCQDTDGNIIGDYYKTERSDLRERKYIHKMKGEHWGVILTEVARKYPFPEVKGFVPEGLVWMEIAKDYDDYCINEPLRIYYQNSPDALSKQRRTAGWVLYHRAVIKRDWRFFLHAPLRIGYSFLVCLFYSRKAIAPLTERTRVRTL